MMGLFADHHGFFFADTVLLNTTPNQRKNAVRKGKQVLEMHFRIRDELLVEHHFLLVVIILLQG